MNDDSPFAAFVPSSPEVTAPAETKNKKARKARKKKTEAKPFADPPGYAKGDVISLKLGGKGAAATVTVATPKKERKKRAAKASKIYKIGIGAAIIALAGLNADDVELLKSAAVGLVDAPKKQRQRVVTALAKIFA